MTIKVKGQIGPNDGPADVSPAAGPDADHTVAPEFGFLFDATLDPDAGDPAAGDPDAGSTSGISGRADGGQGNIGTTSVARSGNQSIDGLLAAVKWSSTSLTYSFPTASSNYGTNASTYGDPAPFNGFSALTVQQQNEVQRAFSLLSSYTQLTFTQITETDTTHAAIRLANSSSPPTSYAYYPSTANTGGDVFYGGTGKTPVEGNFDSGQATLHEIGHALGLKHGQDNNTYGTVPANQLDIEYSLMNYPNYIGSTEGFGTAGPGSSEQTYMMYDIAALQYMYGENLGNVGKTFVYTWSPTTGEEFINGVSQGVPYNNHIFDTVWTGGATATYDLHVYAGSVTLDLRPGKPIDFSPAQLADLGYYGTPGPGAVFAQGDIYNALLYNNDTSSEVSGLIAGNGNDTVYTNDLTDSITLGTGNDSVYAGAGGASITGGGGTDTLIVPGSLAQYTVRKVGSTVTVTDSVTSRTGTETLSGVRYVQFSDQTLDTTTLSCFLRGTSIATPTGERAIETLRAGDLVRTFDGALQPIVWIGHGRVKLAPANRCLVMPVIVRASALGGGLPHRDLRITRDHAVLVPGSAFPVLVPVEHLVNGVSIVWDDGADTFDYFHIELAAHAVLLAEGAPAESYRDPLGRHVFATDRAGPDAEAGCAPAAPLVVDGPDLEAAFRTIASRAPTWIDAVLTDDPDVHLLVDGHRIDAASRVGSLHRFMLPHDVASVALASRSAVPAAIGASADRRRLGVAISRLTVVGERATRRHAVDTTLLADGFYPAEVSHRWTAGLATLSHDLLGDAPRMLDVHIGASSRYRSSSRAGEFAHRG